MTFGSVLSIGTSIFAYYVGSSRGSHQKQQTIDRITK
jgi:ABC-type cobalt transport system substrate-binding protein